MPMTLSDIPDYAPVAVAAETYEEPVTPETAEAVPEVRGMPAEGVVVDEETVETKAEPAAVETESAPVVEAKTEEKPVEAVVATDEPSPLQLACEAVGITETDPAKQLAALKTHTEQAKAKREEAALQTQTQREGQVAKTITDKASQLAHEAILGQLKKAGWELDKTPPPGKSFADPEYWSDYGDDAAETAQAFINAYRDIWEAPTTKAYLMQQEQSLRAEYDGAQTKLSAIADQYKNHDPFVAQLMRDNGVPAELFESVVRSIDGHVQKTNATTHSALVAATQENETLKAQISGHDAALKAAVADERKRILAELGKPNPVSGGTGGPSPTETGSYQSTGIGSGLWARIPKA